MLLAACAGRAHRADPPRQTTASATTTLRPDGAIDVRLIVALDRPVLAVDWQLAGEDDVVLARGRTEVVSTEITLVVPKGASARLLAAEGTLRLEALLHTDGGAVRVELPALLLQRD